MHATLIRDRDPKHKQTIRRDPIFARGDFLAGTCRTLQCDRRFRRTGRSFPREKAGFRANDPLVRPLLSWPLLSIRGHNLLKEEQTDETHAHVAGLSGSRPRSDRGSAAAQSGSPSRGPNVGPNPSAPLKISRIYWEYNSTADDLGVHVSLDGEDWKELRSSIRTDGGVGMPVRPK